MSVGVVYSLYMISDDAYYCGEGRQRIPGRHFWGRGAAVMMEVLRRGTRGLGAWYRERCASSQRPGSTQEAEVDDDYDRYDVE